MGKFWSSFGPAVVAAFSLLVALLLAIATMLSLIQPLSIFVWVVLGGTAVVGLFWQAIKPQIALDALRNAFPRIVMKDFDIDTKRFEDGNYFLCPCVDVFAENASADKVHATVRWFGAGRPKRKIGENPGRWWFANEDLGKSVIDQQYVTLEANGMARRIHFARKNVKSGTLSAWYRNQDGSHSAQMLKPNGKYVVEVSFLSSNRGKATMKFLLVNRKSELIMESLENGNQKRAFT